jgi:hypothetical protein
MDDITSFSSLYETMQKRKAYQTILTLINNKIDLDVAKERAKIEQEKKVKMTTAETLSRPRALPKPKKKSRIKTVGSRINPDATPVLLTAIALVSILMISSFIVSFSGIYTVSAWTGLPPFLQWLPALFIDAAILAYTISLVVFKARGESTWRTFLGLTAFAMMSVVANVAHTLAFWDGELTDFRGWIGVAITASAPIAVLLASEEITRLAFRKPGVKLKK